MKFFWYRLRLLFFLNPVLLIYLVYALNVLNTVLAASGISLASTTLVPFWFLFQFFLGPIGILSMLTQISIDIQFVEFFALDPFSDFAWEQPRFSMSIAWAETSGPGVITMHHIPVTTGFEWVADFYEWYNRLCPPVRPALPKAALPYYPLAKEDWARFFPSPSPSHQFLPPSSHFRWDANFFVEVDLWDDLKDAIIDKRPSSEKFNDMRLPLERCISKKPALYTNDYLFKLPCAEAAYVIAKQSTLLPDPHSSRPLFQFYSELNPQISTKLPGIQPPVCDTLEAKVAHFMRLNEPVLDKSNIYVWPDKSKALWQEQGEQYMKYRDDVTSKAVGLTTWPYVKYHGVPTNYFKVTDMDKWDLK